MSGDNDDCRPDEADGEEAVNQNPALEQWKFYGQTTLDVSNRRLKNNRFYQKL